MCITEAINPNLSQGERVHKSECRLLINALHNGYKLRYYNSINDMLKIVTIPEGVTKNYGSDKNVNYIFGVGIAVDQNGNINQR